MALPFAAPPEPPQPRDRLGVAVLFTGPPPDISTIIKALARENMPCDPVTGDDGTSGIGGLINGVYVAATPQWQRPPVDMIPAAQACYYWELAEQAAAAVQSYVVVGGMYVPEEGEDVDPFVLHAVVSLACAALLTLPGAVAVYNEETDLLSEGRDYREMVTKVTEGWIPAMHWVSTRLSVNDAGLVDAYTNGLWEFGCDDLEICGSQANPGDVYNSMNLAVWDVISDLRATPPRLPTPERSYEVMNDETARLIAYGPAIVTPAAIADGCWCYQLDYHLAPISPAYRAAATASEPALQAPSPQAPWSGSPSGPGLSGQSGRAPGPANPGGAAPGLASGPDPRQQPLMAPMIPAPQQLPVAQETFRAPMAPSPRPDATVLAPMTRPPSPGQPVPQPPRPAPQMPRPAPAARIPAPGPLGVGHALFAGVIDLRAAAAELGRRGVGVAGASPQRLSARAGAHSVEITAAGGPGVANPDAVADDPALVAWVRQLAPRIRVHVDVDVRPLPGAVANPAQRARLLNDVLTTVARVGPGPLAVIVPAARLWREPLAFVSLSDAVRDGLPVDNVVRVVPGGPGPATTVGLAALGLSEVTASPSTPPSDARRFLYDAAARAIASLTR